MSKTTVVKNNKSCVLNFGKISLVPGTNVKTEDEYKILKDAKGFKECLNSKIKGTKEPVIEVDEDEESDFSKMKAADVIELVKNTFSKKELEKIGESDSRVKTVKAIEAQIDLIDEQAKDDDNKDL